MPLIHSILRRLKAKADAKPRRRRTPFPPLEALEMRILLSASVLDVEFFLPPSVDVTPPDDVAGQNLPQDISNVATIGEGFDNGVPVDSSNGDVFQTLGNQDGMVLDDQGSADSQSTVGGDLQKYDESNGDPLTNDGNVFNPICSMPIRTMGLNTVETFQATADAGTVSDVQMSDSSGVFEPSWTYRTLTATGGDGVTDNVALDVTPPASPDQSDPGSGIVPDGFVVGDPVPYDFNGDGIPVEPVVCYFSLLNMDGNPDVVDTNATDANDNPVERPIGPIQYFGPQSLGDGDNVGDLPVDFVLNAYDPLPSGDNGGIVDVGGTGGADDVAFRNDAAVTPDGEGDSPNIIFYSFNSGTPIEAAPANIDAPSDVAFPLNVDPATVSVVNSGEADPRSLWLLFAAPNQATPSGTQGDQTGDDQSGTGLDVASNASVGGESDADPLKQKTGTDSLIARSSLDGLADTAVDEVFTHLDSHL